MLNNTFQYYLIILIFGVYGNAYNQTNPNHVQVKGYTRSDGTYVAPYVRTAPNSTNSDNFSTIGNTNPYTGEAGYIPSDGGTPTNRNYYNTATTTTTPNYTYPSSTNTYSNNAHRGNLTPLRTTSSYNYGDVYEENRLLKERITELENELNEQREAVQFMQEDYRYVMDSIKQSKEIAENLTPESTNQNTESYTPARDSISITPDYTSEDSDRGNSTWPLFIFIGIIVFIFLLGKK